MTSYRYPSETPILTLTIIVVSAVLLLTAGATICVVPLLLGVVVLFAYLANKGHTDALLANAFLVTPQKSPRLSQAVQDCMNRIRPGRLQVFVTGNRALNAYTFGLNPPYSIVLFSPLLDVMDGDEMRFIIGHEMGHIALGHTYLNSILGGMAGMPTTLGAAVILIFAFRWWNRACEYSADRAGLIACGSPQKAVSALIKLVAGPAHSPEALQRAIRAIEAEDDSWWSGAAESLSTHPMLVKRIQELQRWAATPECQRLMRRQEGR